MKRVLEIVDPALRQRVVDALAHRNGVRPEDIPHWYEMDDAAYVELLAEVNEVQDVIEPSLPDDYRPAGDDSGAGRAEML
jgi:hypothetical protein